MLASNCEQCSLEYLLVVTFLADTVVDKETVNRIKHFIINFYDTDSKYRKQKN